MQVPKTDDQKIREGMILQVVIPVEEDQRGNLEKFYNGIGRVKKVDLDPGSPMLKVIV